MKEAKLTYIVASYNYEQYLSETIESLCSQWDGLNPFQILIVDDGSTDNSLEIARSFSQQFDYVKVLTHTNHENRGLSSSIQLALAAVTTEWVTFLESDDTSTSITVSEITKLLVKENGAGLITFGVKPVLDNAQSGIWFNGYVPRIRDFMIAKGANVQSILLDDQILHENLIPTFSCVVVKSELIRACNFNCPVAEWIDWFLWAQILQKNKLRYIDKELVNWRIHDNSQNSRKKITAYLKNYRKFRKALRRTLHNMKISNKSSKIFLLSVPEVFPLAFRFFKMSKYVGLLQMIKQIYRRLSK